MGGLSSTTRISSGRMAHSSSAGLNSTARMVLNSTARMGLNSTARMGLNSTARMDLNSTARMDLNSTARMGLNSTARMDLNSTVRMDLNSTARVDLNSTDITRVDRSSMEVVQSNMVQTDSKVKAASAVGLTELRTIYTTLMLVCRTPRQPRRKRKLDVGEIALMAGCWCCCPLNVSGM